MRPLALITAAVGIACCAVQAQAVTLTPNTNGDRDIQITSPVTDFYTSDGNWLPLLKLPATAQAGATITFHVDTTYDTIISSNNSDLPSPAMPLKRGDVLKLVFDTDQKKWIASVPEYVPGNGLFQVPASTTKLARVKVNADKVVQAISLPATAAPGAMLIVQSASRTDARVEPVNTLHGAYAYLGANQRHVYAFHPQLQKWYLMEAATAMITPLLLENGAMPAITRPRTQLDLPNGIAALSIRLPANANNRDRIRIRSASSTAHTILDTTLDFPGTLKVLAGDVYDFMWVSEKARWVMMSSPTRTYDVNSLAKDASSSRMPATTSPTTRLRAMDGNWASMVDLPAQSRPGDRVIVESSASWPFRVSSSKDAATFTPQAINYGDTVAFVTDAQGRWTRETRTIDMLNIYADKVVAAFGVQAARARQLESFRLTNEALENSGADFRLRMVGLMQHRDQGTTLDDPLLRLRDDATVQTERGRLKADAIYYEGAEQGCGVAWINLPPSARNMVGAGSIACGTTVMRHEFGHNMGLSHNDDLSNPAYARGYGLVGTVMGGNAIPYFSTPLRYDALLGVPMGIPDRVDAVRAMGDHSEDVSNFYR